MAVPATHATVPLFLGVILVGGSFNKMQIPFLPTMMEAETYHIFNWNLGGNHFPTSMMLRSEGRKFFISTRGKNPPFGPRDPGWFSWFVLDARPPRLCTLFLRRLAWKIFEIFGSFCERPWKVMLRLVFFCLGFVHHVDVSQKHFEAPRNPLVACWNQSFPALLRVLKFWDAGDFDVFCFCPGMSTRNN